MFDNIFLYCINICCKCFTSAYYKCFFETSVFINKNILLNILKHLEAVMKC